MLRRLPPPLKRQLRLAGCQAMAHWRRYPNRRQLRQWQLDADAASAFSTKGLAIRNPFRQPMLLRIHVLDHAVRSELLGPGGRPLHTLIQSTVLERLMPSPSQRHPGWHVSTSRFIQQPSQAGWRQDYQSFSHYQPC